MIGTRRITRRSFLAAAGLAAVGASLSLTGCSGSVSDGLSSKHLLVAHSHSEAHPVNVGLQKMTEVASAESDLTFSVYPNGQLGDNAAMIQLVKAGVLDIAKVSASSMEQFNSAYAIFSMPYVFESTEQYFAVMNQSEAVQEIFKSTYDQGFFAIGWFDSGSRSIYTTKDGPCEGPADLKGLKIRTQDSPTSIAMIRAMGGNELSAYGLCHLGDYEATVFSPYSHNRQFGECYVQGKSYTQLAEGYYTVKALVQLAGRYAGVNGGRGRFILALPNALARLQAGLMEMAPGNPVLSRDNLDAMKTDNVASGQLPGLVALGFAPATLAAIVPSYLGTQNLYNALRGRR